jgi:hypothetical protein
LVSIEAYVTVDEELTEPELLNGLWMHRTIKRTPPHIAEFKDTALETLVLLNWHASGSECSFAFLFSRHENIQRN